MATKIEQLSIWLVSRATNQSLTVDQLKAVTKAQITAALPVQYHPYLTDALYRKALAMAVESYYRQKIQELRVSGVQADILAEFPDAQFSVVRNRSKMRLIIEV